MRLEKVSGEGSEALYNLFYENKKIAGPVTRQDIKEALERLEEQEAMKHDKR